MPPDQSFSSAELHSIFEHHDPAALQALEHHLDALPMGAEKLRLGRALAKYEDQRGRPEKARSRLENLLAQSGESKPTQAMLHLDLAEIAFRWGDTFVRHVEAAQNALQGLSIWELDARRYRMVALHVCMLGSYQAARQTAERALKIYRQHGDWPGEALLLNTLAYIVLHERDYPQAARYTRRVLQAGRRQLDPKLQADVLINYGFALRRLGQGTPGDKNLSALPYYQQAVEIQRTRRDPLEFGRACSSLGELYRSLDRYEDAEKVFFEGLQVMAQAQILHQAGYLFNNLSVLRATWGDAAPDMPYLDRFLEQWSQGFLKALQDPRLPAYRDASLGRLILEPIKVMDQAWLDRSTRRLAALFSEPELPHLEAAATAYQELIRAGADPLPALDVVLERIRLLIPPAMAYIQACREKSRSAPDFEADEPVEDEMLLSEFGQQVAFEMPQVYERAWVPLRSFAGLAATLLARSKLARQQVRRDPALVESVGELAPFSAEFDILSAVLDVLDDEELLVFRPGMERGYRLRISGISDNFQLHLLLADALIGDPQQGWLPGQPPHPRLVAAAKDQPVHPDYPLATGVFNLITWRGLQADDPLNIDPDHWIWGEGKPADIPAFDGARIVLLYPPPYARTWNVDRRIADMPAELEVLEILDPPTVRHWLTRLKAAPHSNL